MARAMAGPTIWPMTVVRPLDRMEPVDLHRASTMHSSGLAPGFSARHSAKRWIRNTE